MLHRNASNEPHRPTRLVMTLVAACGNPRTTPEETIRIGESTAPSTAATEGTMPPVAVTPTDAPSPSDVATTTVAPTTTAATSTVPMTTVPPQPTGEPYEGPGPRQGDRVAVVGVAFDDVLNIRAGPGVEYDVVGTLNPLAFDILVTGDARLRPSSIWYEIDREGTIGWVNTSYIALAGGTDDATAELVSALGTRPSADEMTELGLIVAGYFASGDSESRIVMIAAPSPSAGTISEVSYDVIGVGDDAIKGYRLHVFGQRADDAGPFSLYSVERTALCWRGVDPDGRCV